MEFAFTDENLSTKRISSFMRVYSQRKAAEWVVKQRGHQAVSEELQPFSSPKSSWIMYLHCEVPYRCQYFFGRPGPPG
jgi:hypothetical protein